MAAGQVSFAGGEISPLLHARVDLSKYQNGLAELKNMIVLPQGGITRRAGFDNLGKTANNMNTTYTVKLIPFEYNSTDSELLEFGNKEIKIWGKTNDSYSVLGTTTSPYDISEVNDIRYVQSGNVIFLAHKNHKPQILRRNSLTSWTISDLEYRNGPFINGTEYDSNAELTIDPTINQIRSTRDIFTSGHVGTLLKVEYAVSGKSGQMTSGPAGTPNFTEPVEVKGTINVLTSGEWRGMITIQRKVQNGSWIEVRQYRRTDTTKQGQWDITISETEENVLYRVSAWHETLRQAEDKEPIFWAAIENDYKHKHSTELPVKTELTPSAVSSGGVGGNVTIGGTINNGETEEGKISAATFDGAISGQVTTSIVFEPDEIKSEYEYEEGNIGTMLSKLEVKQMSSQDDTPATVIISTSGFLKKEIYEITSVTSSRIVTASRQTQGITTNKDYITGIKLWSIGAWGNTQGYPKAVEMYQDRLVFASTTLQPQTIWMSRTGDYADFGTSDPLTDDDAVTLTLAGSKADSIHSLLSLGDLMAFTTGGEWKIKGYGDSGAITPTALAAHQQTNIGTKNIQPLNAGGRIIIVQTQGQKVFSLGYDLNIDGYSGSEFLNKKISHLRGSHFLL